MRNPAHIRIGSVYGKRHDGSDVRVINLSELCNLRRDPHVHVQTETYDTEGKRDSRPTHHCLNFWKDDPSW